MKIRILTIVLLAAGSVFAGSSMTNSLQTYTDTSTNAATISALEADGLQLADTNTSAKAVTFDSFGATYPDAGNADANFISTIDNYGNNSFVAEVDFVNPNGDPDSRYTKVFFMGIGTGGLGTGDWGLPDVGTSADTIFIENNGGWHSGVHKQESGSDPVKITEENDTTRWFSLYDGHATVTYDAGSNTVTFVIDRDNDSIVFGPFSTEGMFSVQPSRIFFGGKGIMVSSLNITVAEDTTPPDPPTMTFATAPHAISDQAISMTATTAVDDLSGVEYYFTCTSGDGVDSGWQSSTTYVDSGLPANSTNYYTVMARDTSSNQNSNSPSAAVRAITDGTDGTAPSPPPTFAVAPEASPISIFMTATTASDSSGVEYYFDCTDGGGNDSGWQSDPVYYDSGLAPGSNYTYTVQARDLSAATNETAISDPVVVTTPSPELWMVNSLTNYTGDSELNETAFAVAQDSLDIISASANAAIDFDDSGAAFGEGVFGGGEGRSLLRTIAENYGDFSFEAYATFTFSGAPDQAGFIGMGAGIVDTSAPGNYGVPELSLSGVHGILAEMKTITSAREDHKGCNFIRVIDGQVVAGDDNLSDPIATNDTFRARLVYDAVSNTVTVGIDESYAIGASYNEDRELGSFEAVFTNGVSIWDVSPARVYFGGGEGTVIRDVVIRAAFDDAVVYDLSIEGPVAGEMELSWTGLAGQTYDVLYATALGNPTEWNPEASASDIYVTTNGTISATSPVSSAERFFKVIAK